MNLPHPAKPILCLLLVEDSPEDAELLLRTLHRAGYQVQSRRVDTALQLTQALSDQTWDLVISDYSMPQFIGPEALRIVQTMQADLPFIVVSGAVGEERAVEFMKAGAHDYVNKQNLSRLVPAIERELREAEERKARRKAEAQVQKLSTAVEQSATLVVIIDINGRIEYVNPAFTRVSGYLPDEIIGQPALILRPSGQSDEPLESLWRVVSMGGVWRGEMLSRKKSGEVYWSDVTASAIRNPAGEISQIMLVQEDITERKRLEGELQHYAHLQELERFKAEFVANAVHDLSGPITVLSSRLYLMRRLPDKMPEHLPVLENQVRLLKDLVGDLRSLSEIDRGLVALELEETDLNELVRQAVETYHSVALAKQQSMDFLPDPELPLAMLDPRKFERIVINLITNAINYTPEGKAIQVHTDLEGNWCALTIADQGIGIARDDLPHVFERFYRTERARQAHSSGTGLGLSIVKELVTAHGGTIEVDSAVGQGSRFTVRLPLIFGPT